MTICKDCYIPMKNAMSFSKDKHEKFYRCPKCHSETRHVKLNDSVSFGEVLHRELDRKRK